MSNSLLALALIAQGPVIREYDRIRDYTTVSVSVGDLQPKDNPDIMILSLARATKGKTLQPAQDEDHVYLNFHSRSKSWKFLKSRNVYMLTPSSRYEGQVDHEGEVRPSSSAPVAEDISTFVTFGDLRAIAREDSIEVAIGNVEVKLSAPQIASLRQFVRRIQLDQANYDALEREEGLAQSRVASEKASEQKRLTQKQAETRQKVDAEFEAKVERIYPLAKAALINAKNRGSGAPVSTRKSAITSEIDKAARKLRAEHQISQEELDRIMQVGEARDGTAAKKQMLIAKTKAKADARDRNGMMLNAIGNELNKAAGKLSGPGGAPALPRVNNNPFPR